MESGQLKNMIYHLPIRTNDFPQVDFPEVSVTTTARSGEFSKSGWTWTGVRGIESWASHFHDQSLLDVFINLDNTSSIHYFPHWPLSLFYSKVMENFLGFFLGKKKPYVRDLGIFLGKKTLRKRSGKFLCKKKTLRKRSGKFLCKKKPYVRDLGNFM